MEGMQDAQYATETQKLLKHDEGFKNFIMMSRPQTANTTAESSFQRPNAKIMEYKKMEVLQKQIRVFSRKYIDSFTCL